MNGTTHRCHWIVLAAYVLLGCLSAASAETITGWRGDGSGKYPGAKPPTTWSRTSTAVMGLRFLAEKPAGDDAGKPMPDGVIREWLIVGPLPLAKRGAAEEALPDEASLAPEAGQAAGDKRWQRVKLDSAYLNFVNFFGKAEDEDVAAFAFTHVYSATGGPLRVHLTSVGKVQMYLNGKKLPMGDRRSPELAKGWNRLLLRVSPGEKDWYVVPVIQGQGRCDYEDRGIAWRTPLPGVAPAFYGGGMGAGSPVIVGNKIYLLSEPHDLICINKVDGKVLWIRRASYFEAATDDEKKHPAYQDASALAGKIDAINASFAAGAATGAQLQEKAKLESDLRKQMKLIDEVKYAAQAIPDVGFSGFTPCTDGRFIYAWFGDGVSACFALDGTRQWLRVDQAAAVEHGFSSSPLLIDGKFVVFMRDLIAFDAGVGKLAWRTPIVSEDGLNPANFFHGSLAAATIGDTNVIALGNGTIVRAGDGKVLWKETKGDTQSVPSPVVDGRRLLHMSAVNSALTIRTLPDNLIDPLSLQTRTIRVDTSAFPKHYLPWHLSSPLIHDGLAYLVNNAGVLSVIDIETGQIVYQKLLDLDVLQAHNEGAARGVGISPVLAGKHLYFFGNNGAALVIEPGRVYRQVAKNKIENVVMLGHWSERQERFVANPVADGDRLFVRGEEGLYAIGRR